MNNPKDIKEQVRKLLESDQRYQAIRLIQNTYGVNEAEATRLLETLRKDAAPANATQKQIPIKGCGGCASAALKVGSILSLLLGLLFLGVTAFFYYFYEDFKKDATPVRGIIDEVKIAPPTQATDTTQSVFLVFKYSFQDSVYTCQTISSYPKKDFQAKDSVTLLVNPANPEYASLPADEVMQDFYLIFGIATAVMLVIALVLWFLSRATKSATTA
ncbi:MAG: DUF3592 domain-containing protein [Cyclobacteriaceae bacterium]|nr:DUF3592 domain-containing protein [Cyclobacteriaceae bacterium]